MSPFRLHWLKKSRKTQNLECVFLQDKGRPDLQSTQLLITQCFNFSKRTYCQFTDPGMMKGLDGLAGPEPRTSIRRIAIRPNHALP